VSGSSTCQSHSGKDQKLAKKYCSTSVDDTEWCGPQINGEEKSRLTRLIYYKYTWYVFPTSMLKTISDMTWL